jgi:hypothetical protein
MRRMNAATAAVFAFGLLAGVLAPAEAQTGITAFEGAEIFWVQDERRREVPNEQAR